MIIITDLLISDLLISVFVTLPYLHLVFRHLTILCLKFEQVQCTTTVVSKVAGWVANNVDPDETPRLFKQHVKNMI